MAYYLKWPANTGATATNNFLVQISGISGTLSRVQWTLAEDVGAYSIARYFYDMRRLVDSTTQGGGTLSVIAQSGATSGLVTGVTNLQKNGSITNNVGLFTALADDVCSFDTTLTPSGGCIAFGGRFNETESCYGLAVYEIVITDDNGVHTLNMSSSNGSLNQFTSDTGQITLKLVNPPIDDSQWVFYASGPTAYTITTDAVADSHTAQDVTLTYSPGVTAYSITCDSVTDSHLAIDANFYRGYQLAVDGLSDSHTAQSVNLNYSVSGTAYSLTCDSVADSHSAQDAMFYRGYSLLAEQITDNHIASDITLIGGPISYQISCDDVIDTHSQGDVILRYALPSDPIDYGMSGFGHNRQWRNSIFFRGQ